MHSGPYLASPNRTWLDNPPREQGRQARPGRVAAAAGHSGEQAGEVAGEATLSFWGPAQREAHRRGASTAVQSSGGELTTASRRSARDR
jgi:hypothetical protein